MKKIYLLGALAIAVATSLVVGNNTEVQALSEQEALTAAADDIKALPKYDAYAKLFEADAADDEDELKAAILAIKPETDVSDTTKLAEIARSLPHVYEYKYLYELVRFYQAGIVDSAELLEAMQKAVDVCNLLFGVTRAQSLAAKAAAVATTIEENSAKQATTPTSQAVASTSKAIAASQTTNDSLASAEGEPVVVAEPATTIGAIDAPTELIAVAEDNNTDDTPLGTIFAHTVTGVTGIAAAGATLVANRQSGYKGARRGRR